MFGFILTQHVGSPRFQTWSDRKSCHLRHRWGIMLDSHKSYYQFMTVVLFLTSRLCQLTHNILSSHIRKTPVHKLYASRLDRQPQAVGPTKGPPALSQLDQGFHHLYTHIEYECASPYYQHAGSSRRTCLKTGKWSGRHVSCSPGEGSRGSSVDRPLARTTTLTTHI